MMNVPFLNLAAQYAWLKDELPPGWGSLACWLRCSLLTDHRGMLVARASPASQIASNKIGIYF